MHRGYIKLWRKITDWEWFKDSKTLSLFIHFLLEANYKPSRFMGHEIPVGSLVCGLYRLSEDTGLSVQSIRTSIGRLKSTNDITTKSTNHFTIVSIVNFKSYQDRTEYESTNKLTNHQQTTNKQLTTSKECKKDKNDKNKAVNPFFWEFKKLYPNCLAFKRTQGVFESLKVDAALWGVMRTAILEQRKSQQWQNPKYIPASFKWLEEERWKDQLTKKNSVECPF